jgi:fused-like protein
MFLCILELIIHVHFISECTALDKLEKTSQTVTGANSILEDREALLNILSPIRIWLHNPPNSSR